MRGYTNIVLLKGIIASPINKRHSKLNGVEQDWCNFSLAIKDDNYEAPHYFNCIAYADKFEYIYKHCKRNDSIFLRGRLNSYKDPKTKRTYINVIVNDVDILFRDMRKKSLETLESEIEDAIGEIDEDYVFE